MSQKSHSSVFTQVKQNLYLHRNLNVMFIAVFSFYNQQTLGTTQRSLTWGMDKQIMAKTQNETVLSNRK